MILNKVFTNKELLKEQGLKSTPVRCQVIDYIREKGHPTKEEIIDFLKENNLASVYNALNDLAKANIISSFNFEGKTFYDLRVDNHSHKVIKGKIFDIEDEDLVIRKKGNKVLIEIENIKDLTELKIFLKEKQ